MFELHIFDMQSGRRTLIPFSVFLESLLEEFGQHLRGEWRIFHGADGYGELVIAIADSLKETTSVVVNSAELLPVLLSGEEYFEDARIEAIGTNVEFGISDSSFLFVRGNRDNLEKIAKRFDKVEVIEIKMADGKYPPL